MKIRQGLLPASLLVLICLVFSGCDKGGTAGTGTVSGALSCPGYRSGEIYVLALKSSDGDRIREMEMESCPYLSRYVASYAAIPGPGPYEIPGLAGGEYVLWSWNDVNGDGGVNHLDYAEPVGWHQTAGQLFPPVSVPVFAGQCTGGIDLTLVSLTPFPEGERQVTAGRGGGTLRTVNSQKVLHLRGTDGERGYAYGFLVGRQIVEWINYTFIEYFARSASFYEETFLPFVRQQCVEDPRREERDAMLRGMRDSGIDMELPCIGREIGPDDLLAQNNLYLLLLYPLRAHWPLENASFPGSRATACTSAVFWGPWTRESLIPGELIHGKNNDGENDLRKMTVNGLLVIAEEPPSGSSLKKVVRIDWPGFCGTYHGMNEEGLVLASHGVVTMPDWDAVDFLDYSALYLETLRNCATIEDVRTFWESFPATRPAGWNTGISSPSRSPVEGNPSVTWETDSFGGAIREPDFMEPSDPCSILTTNNFFKYTGAVPKAVSLTKAYHGGILPDNYRYRAMLDLLDGYEEESQAIGTTEIIEFLRIASNLPEYHDKTEFSVIFYPDRMTLSLAKEDLANKNFNAPYAEYRAFGFNDLFQ